MFLVPDQVAAILADKPAVAVGVSGGKDSIAAAFATDEYLKSIGYVGPKVLIHSDLGRVEWRDSLPTCERLAKHIGWELVVVRRKAGGMMERWLSRWENSVYRYAELECVKLILPWSTPSMRFCTAELKRDIICRDLVLRYPGRTILSVSGIRREESANRKKSPIMAQQIKLKNTKYETTGYDWHPILDWKLDDVFRCSRENNFPLHEAYDVYGSSRVSCVFCIMSKWDDLVASTTCEDNADIYREMVDLEIRSTFSFQGSTWLADVAPRLLSAEQLEGLAEAKRKASLRAEAESVIPPHLLYTSGWPTCIPTVAEATMLTDVRTKVADLCGIDIKYRTPMALRERYSELFKSKKRPLPLT